MASLRPKVPPLLLAVAVAGVMWLVTWLVPSLGLAIPARRPVAAALFVVGVVACAAGVVSFRLARTTVNPMNPSAASSLVTGGIYRFTRNPMYVGFAIGLLALAVFLAHPLAFLGPVAFVAHLNQFQIPAEEAALAARFGPAYAAYRSQVRRWV